jgi:hypothetical protein
MWYKVTDDYIDFRCKIDKSKIGQEAANLAVQNIMKKYPPPYHIMVSGGVDSQATLYSWKSYGKNYIPTFVRYNNNLNEHDYEELKVFADQQNIQIYQIDYDLLDFYNTRYDQMTKDYKCPSPQILAHIDMTKNLPGTVILSGNFLSSHYAYHSVPHALTLESYKRNFIGFFLLSYPELAYTELVSLANTSFTDIKIKPNSYDYKIFLYHKNGFPVIPQERKFSGFEKVKDYYDQHYKHLVSGNTKVKYMHKPSKRTFDLLLRYPYEDVYGLKQKKIYINEDIRIASYEANMEEKVQNNYFHNLKKQNNQNNLKNKKINMPKFSISLKNNLESIIFIMAFFMLITGYIVNSTITSTLLYLTILSLFLSIFQKIRR